MNEAGFDKINEGTLEEKAGKAYSQVDFRNEILIKVNSSIPDASVRWERAAAAEKRAVSGTKEAIRTACEISVAISSNKEEAEAHIALAGRVLLTEDRDAMGLHLASRLDAIDGAVRRAEKNGWASYSPEQKTFVEGEFRGLCSKLDTVALDPDLIRHCPDVRKQLFPIVDAAEHRRESARGPLRYTGPKGVSDLMESEVAKGGGEAIHNKNSDKVGTGLTGRTSMLPNGLKGTISMIQGLRRESSPNVCQR